MKWRKKRDGSFEFSTGKELNARFANGERMADMYVMLSEEYEKLRSALCVIQTWAEFDNGETLVPSHVSTLCRKVLRRPQP